TRHLKVLINISVVGEVRVHRSILRSGARPGDLVYVSGRLGEAELGFRLWKAAARRRLGGGSPTRKSKRAEFRGAPPLLLAGFLSHFRGELAVEASVKKHLYPEPRTRLAQWLAKYSLASSMMDLSDGLSSDLPRLCDASGVGAQIEAAKIPSVTVPKWNGVAKFDAFTLSLNGGDDYELLFTVSRSKANRIPGRFQGLPLTRIGEITRQCSILVAQPNGRISRLKAGGWDPFAGETIRNSRT